MSKSKIFRPENSQIPIWFMRQAGRYQNDYLKIRKTEKDFLKLCYNTEKVCQITKLPINSFKFDAAIIFSDILVLPHILGWDVKFVAGEGPVLRQFTSADDLHLFNNEFNPVVNNIYSAISKLRQDLSQDVSLIGFVGAPWTVVSYLLEGRGKQNFSISKSFLYNNPKLIKQLIGFITEKTILHVIAQIKAGAEIIQIFDSWAGMLSGQDFEKFVIQPTAHIVKEIKKQYPQIPIIGFPRGAGYQYDKFIESTNIDIISVDQYVPIEKMSQWQKKLTVQGNLDPVILLSSKDVIAAKADNILKNMAKENFIFNLGHGILPNTPEENVQFLVDYVRNYQK